ncbi:MAG: 23S rRNA pseudouridine(955/2504/2580) synthase RluC [Gammaproteobacteria bacterium]|nr:23S rRNA pseudouridine(955/2504/2580) synthase RluC [Gammaproteobacteria bacterium]
MTKTSVTPVQYITIQADYADQRIDNFLVTFLKSMPKTRIYRLLRKGEIRVNKKRIQPSYRLQADDILRLPPMELDDKPAPTVPGKRSVEMLTDRILYEDSGLFIINKPSGLPVHGGSMTSMGVVETLRAMYPTLPNLELVHRLDADTSGCLILAKKRSVLRELHGLMRAGEVNKVYLALTKGQWRPTELRVEAALRKNHLAGGERIVKVDQEGKPSLTVFEPVQSYPGAMLVEATLHTGRTHQIRVHARYRSHPIAGDEKYGDREFNKEMRQFGLKRLFLHAHRLEFTIPSTGQKIKVKAPLDADLQDCLDKMKKI